MSFDASLRIALETTAAPGSLQSSLVTELLTLDAEAKRMRAIGQVPLDDLRPQIDTLRASVSRVRIETIEKNRGLISEYENAYRIRRDKNATVEVMRQADAKLRVSAMVDSEVDALAIAYVNGSDLDLPTLRELQSRARNTPDLEHLTKSLRDEMESRRAETPWVSEDPKALALADEMDLLALTEPGTVRIETDDMVFVSEIADLVDYDGELDAPA